MLLLLLPAALAGSKVTAEQSASMIIFHKLVLDRSCSEQTSVFTAMLAGSDLVIVYLNLPPSSGGRMLHILSAASDVDRLLTITETADSIYIGMMSC